MEASQSGNLNTRPFFHPLIQSIPVERCRALYLQDMQTARQSQARHSATAGHATNGAERLISAVQTTVNPKSFIQPYHEDPMP